MSWLYSQALVEEYSRDTGWDGAPSAPLSVMHTPHKFWRNDKTMEASDLSRFGLTCAVLTADRGEDLLTWYRGASLARTSASPAREPESMASAVDCGPTWPGSLARFDPATASWKTAQPSLLEDLGESSVIWPRSGMTAGGRCWELPMSERRTKGTGSGLWPTPTTQDNVQIRGVGSAADKPKRGTTLAGAVKMWPTPQASDNRNRGNADTPAIARRIAAGKQVMLTMMVSGGQLNPAWVEWLMGWPIGWTDLRPLETDRCHSALPLLGNG